MEKRYSEFELFDMLLKVRGMTLNCPQGHKFRVLRDAPESPWHDYQLHM